MLECNKKKDIDISNNFKIFFSVEKFGFGELTFYKENNKIFCDNEYMGKDFIKQMLCALVDKCELTNGE